MPRISRAAATIVLNCAHKEPLVQFSKAEAEHGATGGEVSEVSEADHGATGPKGPEKSLSAVSDTSD